MRHPRLVGLALYKLGTFLGGSAVYIPAKHVLASWGVPVAWTGVLAILVCALVITGLWLRRPRWLGGRSAQQSAESERSGPSVQR